MPKTIPILIPCYKNDFYLTRICVASIRFYYPDVPIYILKDLTKGDFNTRELELYFNVKKLDLGQSHFGWTTSKMFALLSKDLPYKRVFILDSDTVFVGKVLETIYPYSKNYQFVVSPETHENPKTPGFKKYTYNLEFFKKIYPSLKFPGYTFNTGNILITPGAISETEIKKYFIKQKPPFWTKFGLKHLPTRDQSLLNIILSLRNLSNKKTLKAVKFMWWHLDPEVQSLSIDDVRTGKFPYLIHWAGATRSPFLLNTTRGDILTYFLHYYYLQVPFGKLRYYLNFFYHCFLYLRYDLAVYR